MPGKHLPYLRRSISWLRRASSSAPCRLAVSLDSLASSSCTLWNGTMTTTRADSKQWFRREHAVGPQARNIRPGQIGCATASEKGGRREHPVHGSLSLRRTNACLLRAYARLDEAFGLAALMVEVCPSGARRAIKRVQPKKTENGSVLICKQK